jgi:hypothetical protein
VRNADFDEFQRSAPDLASFIGPKIYDASRMMFVCRQETLDKINQSLPEPFQEILRQLPGAMPTHDELRNWKPLSESDES